MPLLTETFTVEVLRSGSENILALMLRAMESSLWLLQATLKNKARVRRVSKGRERCMGPPWS